MTPTIVILIIIGAVLMDGLIIGSLLWGFSSMIWGPLARRFPPREPAPDAVGRRFQSFSIGMFNLGCCIHVMVDETHLHLTPVKPFRLCGTGPISVPWDAIQIVKRPAWRRLVIAKIGDQTIAGPAWCLELAEPPPPTPPDEPSSTGADQDNVFRMP